MKRKIWISLVLTLLMIVSTFTVATVNAEVRDELQAEPCDPLEVTKKVWDGEGWVDELIVEIGDPVTFNITITYNALESCSEILTDIKVTDTIVSPDITYTVDVSGSEYQPSEMGNPIIWNLSDDYGVELLDRESVSIEFEVTLTAGESGELVNHVVVQGYEHCCNVWRQDGDSAKIILEEEPCVPGIEVSKTVKDGEDWVEYLDDIKIGDMVKFKIHIVYNACDDYQLLNMEITDYLPDCLEYNNTLEIKTSGYKEDPIIIVDGKTIYWKWVDTSSIILEDDDYLTVIFDTEFKQYCCECPGDNYAHVKAWGCQGPQYYFEDEDCATVNCISPPTTFDKYVLNGEEWVKDITTYKDTILEFKIELVYYGKEPCDNEPLTNIKFVDWLHCILEYVEGSFESNLGENLILEISEDGKTLYLNASADFVLSLSETITITFKAKVVGCTDCDDDCNDCEGCEAWNRACVYGGCQEPYFEMCDEVQITAYGNCPPDTPQIRGPSEGEVDEDLEFYVVSTDPDDDNVFYKIKWGDGIETIDIGPGTSGVEVLVGHKYSEPGTYYITAMAEDVHGAESDWTPEGYEHVVVITEPEEEDLIELGVKRLGFGRIGGTIKNIAEETLTDVEWNISLVGGTLNRVNVKDNGTFSEMAPGASKTVYTGPMFLTGSVGLLRFGRVDGEIKATANGKEYGKTFHGWVISKLVLITKID